MKTGRLFPRRCDELAESTGRYTLRASVESSLAFWVKDQEVPVTQIDGLLPVKLIIICVRNNAH